MILDTNALSAFADDVPPVVQQIATDLPVLTRDAHFDAVPGLTRLSW